ncbi:uncharacterized protein LOC144860431 isoform X2 [Branchiostoma floridae x Branchiostoma japonicum]
MSSIERGVSVLVPFSDYNPKEENELLRCPSVQVQKVLFSNIGDNTQLLTYVKQVKKTVKDADVNTILTWSDMSTFVNSAVVRDVHTVSGPSVEACFLAFHKAYTREYLDPTVKPLPYCTVDLDSPTTDAKEALSKVGYPAFMKPATGCSSFGVKKVYSYEEVNNVLDNLRKMKDEQPKFLTAPSASFFKTFYEKYLDVTKYPLALRDVVIIEPYLEAEKLYVVDGCVVNGSIVHWVITDTLRFDEQDARFVSMILPTTADDDLQNKIWEFYDAVMTRMIQFGFDNSFANIEVFKMKDGEIRLCEVNARASRHHHALYSRCLEHGRMDDAIMSAGCGIQVFPPVPTGKHGIMYPVYFQALETPGNLLYFDELKADSDVDFLLFSRPDDEVVDLLSNFPQQLCTVLTFGETREVVVKKLTDVLQLIVKKPEKLTYPIANGI